MTDQLLESVQKDFAAINKAAGEFLNKLLGNNIKKDVTLAAELSGLKLLRETKVDFSKLDPGTVLLGAISDEVQDRIQRFIVGLAAINKLDLPKKFEIPDDVKDCLLEVVQFEATFDDVCKKNGIRQQYYPFVAATAAMKLVKAGKITKLLDPKVGFCVVSYHIIAGSKTVPDRARASA